MNKLCAAILAAVAGGALLFPAASADAATVKPGPGSRPASSAGPLVLPNGYTLVQAGPLTAASGAQTHGSVSCPGTRQPSGGGAFVSSDALTTAVNSSYPSGQSWAVDINNTSGASTNFYVYAICLAHAAGYTVVASSSSVGDSTQSWAADCPAHTGVFGGGALSGTSSTGVNINSTVPNQLAKGATAWRVAMSSSDSTESGFTVYAVCRPKPKGYSIQFNAAVVNPAGGQTVTDAFCPGSSLPVGGGGFSGFFTADTAVTMSASWPGDSYWAVDENNGGTASRSLEAAVVCAGT